MLRSLGPLAPLPAPDLDWDPSTGLPRSNPFQDGYFGSEDAVAESRYVFVEGSRLPERLAATSASFTIAELGFGTGLNFLLAWECFDTYAPRDARLHYIGIERWPLRRRDLERALGAVEGTRPEHAAALGAALPPPLQGIHRRVLGGGRVLLDLYYADAALALKDLASYERKAVNAWYLDGFAPSRNAQMWDSKLFDDLARCSARGASVATFSAAGRVRRDLAQAGFDVQRRPGFGRKRECLQGQLLTPKTVAAPTLTPWDLKEQRTDATHVIVVGAGLAGAHTASALARRGCNVRVFDAGTVAARASGNPQGLLFTRLSHERSTLADFSLLAFLHAAHIYRDLMSSGRLATPDEALLNGCFQTPPPRGDFQAVVRALESLPELGTALTAESAAERLGHRPAEDGLWLHDSGWLAPPAVCRALLDAPGIELRCDVGPIHLVQDQHGVWEARDVEAQVLARAPSVVVCAGGARGVAPPIDELPLRVARGQTTQLPQPPGAPLRAAVCHRGYLAPSHQGEHCIGATFAPGVDDRSLRHEDHATNLRDLAQAIPAWASYLTSLDPTALAGRAELRCVSPDYLPLVGPVPDAHAFRKHFAPLGKDAKRILNQRGSFVDGLYVHTALGSRGLSYAALGAEILASELLGEAPPVSRELCRAVAPARFLIRDLTRKRS